jgi:hypothetical protein
MKNRIIASALFALVAGQPVYSQTPAAPKESHKYRTIFTLSGAGGGFALGVFAGLAAFDDSVNSDRKVWTTALVSAAGGAVGGYFVGRTVDKRHMKRSSTAPPSTLFPGAIPNGDTLLPAAKAALATLSEPKHAGIKPAPTGLSVRTAP